MAKQQTPSSLTIRVYNVGFGDCFLLTFQYPGESRHVLIDFGSTAAPKRAPADYMTHIAEDIKNTCQGKLHVLVATHRHRDHINGFVTTGAAPGKIIRDLKPDYVIQPGRRITRPNPARCALVHPFTARARPIRRG
jgi:glyoxylase-like metal-dependent hydrolase (beta-lactamase superfamily II)